MVSGESNPQFRITEINDASSPDKLSLALNSAVNLPLDNGTFTYSCPHSVHIVSDCPIIQQLLSIVNHNYTYLDDIV